MITENSGNIYQFELDFNYGFTYAELLDFSDISAFDGIMIQVYNLIENERRNSNTIQEIVTSGIKLGPVPINKYPGTKGKNAWKLIGKNENFATTLPFFKNHSGNLSVKDWSKLSPWRKYDLVNNNLNRSEFEYDEIRELETLILNSTQSISIKLTMMKLIDEEIPVNKFYDLKELGNRNLYLQVANTYYFKDKAIELLQIID